MRNAREKNQSKFATHSMCCSIGIGRFQNGKNDKVKVY